MSDILDQILEDKRAFLEQQKESVDLEKIKETGDKHQPRDFASALKGKGIQLISEIKPKAPSAGSLTDLDPEKIAWVYQEECPAAVSVLTDEPYFGMTLDDFRKVRAILDKPVLRKEFIIDPFQIHRTAALGADAVLLIASVLSPDELAELHEKAVGYDLQCLVEVHSLEEWESVPFTPELLGINNRTLEGDFSTDLSVTEQLAPRIPDEATIVSESGIETHDDIQRLADVPGVEAVLVGSALLESAGSPEEVRHRVRKLMGEDS
ncbi:MAG: indole-3-glycerol-phosphate synthase [bacterium]